MSDRELLDIIMNQLYRWAKQSQSGGWSTHQVEPQRMLASQIAEHLATTDTSAATPALLNALTRYRADHDQRLRQYDRPCRCEMCEQADEAIAAAKGSV